MTKPQAIRTYPGPGFRIRQSIQRPEPDLVRAFAGVLSQDLSDLLNGLYALDSAIRALAGPPLLLGPACTVRLPAHDNLMLHKALDVAQPGDVLVVAAGGDSRHASCGEMIAQKARHRGIGGLIIDGLIRDLADLQTLNLPVFARGVTPVAPTQHGPGEINLPVSCGGIVIQPGDLMLADGNGIVAIPLDFAPALLERLERWRHEQNPYQEAVRRGDFDNDWLAARLTEVEYHD